MTTTTRTDPRRRVLGVTLLAALLLALLQPAAPASGSDPRRLLRPTDGPSADDGYPADAEVHTWPTSRFRLHWVSEGVDAATTAYVKEVGAVLEDVWARQVEDLGWPAPPADAGVGGDDRVDVYLVDLADGPYGYVEADEEAFCGTCDAVHGYLVLDNDYAGFPPDPSGALRATAAHEFGHLIHFGIAYDAEAWAYEATAAWFEQVLYPDDDARTVYLTDYAADPTLSLTDFDAGSGGFDRAYGAYVWNLWLAAEHGERIVRDAWLAAGAADEHVLAGYDRVLRDRSSSFADAFVRFTAATAAWERGGFPGEPAAFPPVTRQGFMASGEVRELTIDHAAAQLLDVTPADEITLTVRGPRFVRGGVALVAGSGTSVLTAVDATLFDGEASVTLQGVAGASRVTAVIVNADVTLAVPRRPGSDLVSYLNDGVGYVVGVDVDPGAPLKR